MAFSPLARFRNYTVKNLKALLEVYPDLAGELSWGEAGDLAETQMDGYKKTAAQQGCQFGLEDRSGGRFRVQTYLYTFEDGNLERFIRFWIKTYFAPNPYVKSEEPPFLIYCELAKEILESEDLTVDYDAFFARRIGGGSKDILFNCLKNYAAPLIFKPDHGRDLFGIRAEDFAALAEEVEFIETEFAIGDPKDKAAFFERYTYANFCKFYHIAAEFPESPAGGSGADAYRRTKDGSGWMPDGDSRESADEAERQPGLSERPPGLVERQPCMSERPPGLVERQPRMSGGENVLLYGVPGAGKSHTIRTRYCSDPRYMERVVFHPDYTYSDFVGQILPRVEGERVTYEFTPGPFTRVLQKAWDDPQHMYYLVIEEINRGNAPAIFGEIFQLLDRKRAGSRSDGEAGESEYGIAQHDVAKRVYGDREQEVRIPSNLSVLATMNTSDQNVFTLDTAFQRRWKMCHIRNRVEDAAHADVRIEGTGISWGAFALEINERLTSADTDMVSSEDRRLGAYFVTEDGLLAEPFSEKVLKYLWDDAFRLDREAVFQERYRALDEVLAAYQDAEGDRLLTVLRPEVYEGMRARMSGTQQRSET